MSASATYQALPASKFHYHTKQITFNQRQHQASSGKYFIISRTSFTPDLMNITYNNGERTNLYSFQATGHSVQVNNIFPLT